MKHIDHLSVAQFRGLRRLELHDLGHVNLFVGGNNSGKTSVLEALAIYARPLDPLEWLNTARRREVMGSSFSILESLRWCFPLHTPTTPEDFFVGEARMSGIGVFPVRNVIASYREIRGERVSGESTAFDSSRRGADLTISTQFNAIPDAEGVTDSIVKTFRFWDDETFVMHESSHHTMLPVKVVPPHAHRVERLQINQLSEAALSELNDSALAILQSFDKGVEGLSIWSPAGKTPILYIKHRALGLVPMSAVGDAMRRVLFISTAIPLCRDGILLIDEVETAIHTQALQTTFDWLITACTEHHVQLFVTTHSLEAVDAILEACDTKTELVSYRLQQHPSKTQATRLDQEVLQRLREVLGREVRW